MIPPIYWRRRVISANTIGLIVFVNFHVLNRQSGSKVWNSSRHRLLIKRSNRKRSFTQKRYVQNANDPRSPQSQTETSPSRPTSFFVTIYLQTRLDRGLKHKFCNSKCISHNFDPDCISDRCTAKTKCQKFETNIPRKGIMGPQFQFPHSCVCERIIYSNDGSAFSAGGNIWTDPGNI